MKMPVNSGSVGIGRGLLGVLTLVLLSWTVRGWTNAGEIAMNRQLQEQIAERDRERGSAGLLDMAATAARGTSRNS